jgi:hypothetical protein
MFDTLLGNHALRIVYCVPRRTSLIQENAMLSGLDPVATP